MDNYIAYTPPYRNVAPLNDKEIDPFAKTLISSLEKVPENSLIYRITGIQNNVLAPIFLFANTYNFEFHLFTMVKKDDDQNEQYADIAVLTTSASVITANDLHNLIKDKFPGKITNYS